MRTPSLAPASAPVMVAVACLQLGGPPALGAQDFPREVRLSDPAVGAPELAISDARSLRAEASGNAIEFTLEMARPIEDGVFTCLHLYFDVDGDRSTDASTGAECWVRGAVGSRFRPNSFGAGEASAMALNRLTRAYYDRSGGQGGHWNHQQGLDRVRIDGNVMTAVVPLQWLSEAGLKYERGVAFRARVETSCSDQPIPVTWLCAGEFLPIEVDGDLGDWLGGRVVEDPVGELHQNLQELDIRTVRVEHGDGDVKFAVEFAAPGFGAELGDGDLIVEDAVEVLVDPMRPRYQPRAQFVIPRERSRSSGDASGLAWSAQAGNGTLECAIARRAGQNRLRLYVSALARRYDELQGGDWVRIGWGE